MESEDVIEDKALDTSSIDVVGFAVLHMVQVVAVDKLWNVQRMQSHSIADMTASLLTGVLETGLRAFE